MNQTKKRSGGKLRPGDFFVATRKICFEVVTIVQTNNGESELSVRIRPGQQEAFVESNERFEVESVVEGRLPVGNNKRFEYKGNVKELEADCRHKLQVLRQLGGPQSATAQRQEVPSTSSTSESAE